MHKMPLAVAILGALVAATAVQAQDQQPEPAVRIRLSHPDQQLQEVLRLFKGAKAPSPAAALAAWKRASKDPNRLGKPLEALIAAGNPRMVEELKTLDQAELSIRFDPETGLPGWSAILPEDDGTFAALATAFVLSGGAAEPPMGEVAIDRLAGPGSPVMARVKGGTLLASDRDAIKQARARLDSPGYLGEIDKNARGIRVSVEAGSLKGSKLLPVRRVEELIRPLHDKLLDQFGSILAHFDLEQGGLISTVIYADLRPYPKATIEPSWYDWTPRSRAFNAFAVATDPAAASWDKLYALADRIEKIDPARADVASLQVRIDLVARLVGLRLETDLLQHLRGVSGWVGSNDSRSVNNGFLMLHLDDADAAQRIVVSVKPLPGSGSRPEGEPESPRWLGKIEGQSLRICRRKRAVILTWGDGVLESSEAARNDPALSEGGAIRELTDFGLKPLGAGLVWPERIPRLGSIGPKKENDPNEANRPLVWQVYADHDLTLSLVVVWPDIERTVQRFLDSLPLDAPPDR